MRIFVDESNRYGSQPLFMAIVEELLHAGIAGSIVQKGIEGFGPRREVHALRAFVESTDLPIVVEVVDTQERIAAILPRLRDMLCGGLITLQTVAMQRIEKPA
jgi:PII-like signaling protein